jgi:TolB-like protein
MHLRLVLLASLVFASAPVDAAPKKPKVTKKVTPEPVKHESARAEPIKHEAAKVEPAAPRPEPTVVTTVVETAKPAPVEEAPAPPPAPVRQASPPPSADAPVVTNDKTPRGAMKELAGVIGQRFFAKNGAVSFHRVAIPHFKNASPNADKEKVGQLVAEILSVELAEEKKFVIVERERMDQIMKEHRLKDLGVVDEGSAAEFGKILGAQSLVLGTVTEAGPSYIVTVRQVDAEKGDVIVSAQVEIERQGLIAISSDAIETRTRLGAGFRSAVFPGWGQIYNKQPVKGGIFMALGIGVLGAAGTMIGVSTLERNRYALNRPDTVDARVTANNYILAANLLLISYGVVWAVSIIDALVSGKDHTTFNVSTDTPGAVSF